MNNIDKRANAMFIKIHSIYRQVVWVVAEKKRKLSAEIEKNKIHKQNLNVKAV